MYKVGDWKAKFKKQAVGGQNQFDAAHGALRQASEPYQANGPNRLATDFDEYFDALAAAATTENNVLEELVRYNAALTTHNAELLASVESLIESNKQLSCWVENHQSNKKTTRYLEDIPPHPKTLCPYFKIIVIHAPDLCFDLEKMRPDVLGGGRVVCDNGGHQK